MMIQSELNSPNTVTGAGGTGQSFLDLKGQQSLAYASEMQKVEKEIDASPHDTELPPPPNNISMRTQSMPNSPARDTNKEKDIE